MVFQILAKVLAALLRPFSTAESLDQYARGGYFLLGLVVLSIHLALFAFGYELDVQLRDVHPALGEALKELLTQYHLGFLEPLSRQIIIGEVATYLIIYQTTARRTVGLGVASIVFRTVDFVLRMGEWCTDNHSISAGMLVMLVVAIPIGFFLNGRAVAIDNGQREQFQELKIWLEAAEELVVSTPLTQSEPDRLASVESKWRNYFAKLPVGTSGNSPILQLHATLRVVLGRNKTSADNWMGHLELTAQEMGYLGDAPRKLAQVNMPGTSDIGCGLGMPCQHAQDVLSLLAAKIQIRLAGDACAKCEHTEPALRFLESIKADSLHDAKENGLANVYSCIVGRLVEKAGDPESLASCQSAYAKCGRQFMACTELTIRMYHAIRGKAPCSRDSMRVSNNSLDLLVKIALNFGYVSSAGYTMDRLELVKSLREQATALFKCQPSEPLAAVYFFTAAQARGAAAQLAAESPDSETLNVQMASDDAAAAGHLLEIALLFDQQAYRHSDLRTFCFAMKRDSPIAGAFWTSVTAMPKIGPTFPTIFNKILESQCTQSR